MKIEMTFHVNSKYKNARLVKKKYIYIPEKLVIVISMKMLILNYLQKHQTLLYFFYKLFKTVYVFYRCPLPHTAK